MISPGALEEGVLALLVFSPEHAATIAMRVDKHPWTNSVNRKIATASLEYLAKYNQPPGSHIDALCEQWMKGEEGKLLAQTLHILGDQITVINPEFILDELETFIQSQRLREGLERALESLHRGELDIARKEVSNAQQVDAKADGSEIWFKDPRQVFAFLETADEDFFSSGVDAIDQVGATPERGTLSIMLASTGKGKSWWLGECGKRSLQHHHPALHITLENSQKIVACRYLQSFFAVTKREAQQLHTAFFNPGDEQRPIDFRDFERNSVLTERRNIEAKLRAMTSYPRLLIKKFPTGQLTIGQLRMYLDYLKNRYGFVPHSLMLDYADLMFIDSAQLRIDTGRLYKELRGVADEYNLALYTASQGNRESDTAKTVQRNQAAEDWSKIGTADNVYTYSQTNEEYKLGMARILTAKSRNERDRFMVLVSQAYSIGQFCLDSMMMNVDVTAEVDRLTGND